LTHARHWSRLTRPIASRTVTESIRLKKNDTDYESLKVTVLFHKNDAASLRAPRLLRSSAGSGCKACPTIAAGNAKPSYERSDLIPSDGTSLHLVSPRPVSRFPLAVVPQHLRRRRRRQVNSQFHCQSPPLRRPSLPREPLATRRKAGPELTPLCDSVESESPFEPRSAMTVTKHRNSPVPIQRGHHSHSPVVAFASAPAGSLPFDDDRAHAGTGGASTRALQAYSDSGKPP
jgi:hypothetical protein